MPTKKDLQHAYDTTLGLWCIDRNPAEVDYDWIKKNAFQLKDYLQVSGDETESAGISIGRFTLTQGSKPGKIWMTGPSGEGAEVDAKVLEDVLKSFF
jgi:hypothetical protein